MTKVMNKGTSGFNFPGKKPGTSLNLHIDFFEGRFRKKNKKVTGNGQGCP